MHLLIMVGVVWTENISCVFRVKLPFSNYSVVVCNGPETLCCKPRFHSIYNEPDKLGRHGLIKSYTLTIPTFY